MNDTSNSASDPAGLHTLQVISKATSFNSWMFDQFRSFLKGEVLEIGSGIGNISQLAMDEGFSITLSDYNTEYTCLLNEKFKHADNVKDILSIDLLHPGFENYYRSLEKKFDSILLLNVIEHLQNDSAAIQNCLYLLKPGGHLIVLAPAYQWLYCNFDKELGHHRRYTLKSMLLKFKTNDIQVVRKIYFNFLGIAGWLVFGKIFGKKILGSNEMSAFNKLVSLAKVMDKLIFNKAGLSVIVIGVKK
ncbi:MAG: class I SAM-dependent methyltransferase [Chitinophagaceae bacterium]|nr:MAG: class I SAM-dependent methyltransferase [Chitinophagaceae bacterium]